jgi:hypothetical protein
MFIDLVRYSFDRGSVAGLVIPRWKGSDKDVKVMVGRMTRCGLKNLTDRGKNLGKLGLLCGEKPTVLEAVYFMEGSH